MYILDDSDFAEIDGFSDDSDKEWTNAPWNKAPECCASTIQSEGKRCTPNRGWHENIRGTVYKRNGIGTSTGDPKNKMTVKDKIKLFDNMATMENTPDRAEPYLGKSTRFKPRNYEDATKSGDTVVTSLNQPSRKKSRSEQQTYGWANNHKEGKYENLGKQISDTCIQPEDSSSILDDNAQPSTRPREVTPNTQDPAQVNITRENKKRVSFFETFVDMVASSVQSFKDIFHYPMIM